MPIDPELAKKVSQAREIAENLNIQMRLAIALNAMHLRGAFENDVVGAFNNTYEAWGYNLAGC